MKTKSNSPLILNSDNILVELPLKGDLEKQDGIYIPDTNQSKHLSQLIGKVIAFYITGKPYSA